MRRKASLYNWIYQRENLDLAFRKAVKGKRGKREVIEFCREYETHIRILQKGLMDENPHIGHYHFFTVRDPKVRRICTAAFPEQVLHHAVMNVCEPVLESFAIYDSYACRKGKGQRKALSRSQAFARKYPWYLKLDIRKYFDSIDHEIAVRLLSRRISDRKVLLLFQRLLDTYQTKPGKGIPIGNLISQHLANFYLGFFDRWVKEVRQVKGYLRYMDDFILFGHDLESLTSELAEIQGFLDRELALVLKENIQLNRCRRGLPFLGYRVFPYYIRLSPRSKKRFIRKFIDYEGRWAEGIWSDDEFARRILPLFDFTMAANAKAFRQNVIKRFGVPF